MNQDVHRIITSAEDRVAADLQALIEGALTGVGLLCRVFARVKAPGSVAAKRDERARRGEPYSPGGKRMQDLFGVRVVLYFADDVPIAERIVRSLLDHDSTAIDDVPGDQFGPVRYNIVYRLRPDLATSLAAPEGSPDGAPMIEEN